VKKLNPAAIRRRSLKKFGDALGQNSSDNLTVVSTEEIFLERTRPAGAKAEPEKGADLASLGNASLIVCRTCGKKGDHWTSKCPFKELAATKGFAVGGEKPPTDDDMGVPGLTFLCNYSKWDVADSSKADFYSKFSGHRHLVFKMKIHGHTKLMISMLSWFIIKRLLHMWSKRILFKLKLLQSTFKPRNCPSKTFNLSNW